MRKIKLHMSLQKNEKLTWLQLPWGGGSGEVGGSLIQSFEQTLNFKFLSCGIVPVCTDFILLILLHFLFG